MRAELPEPIERIVCGHSVSIDHAQGHLCVVHDGTINWDTLQDIKAAVWGPMARAIEVYPADDRVVNAGNYRHLWRLGDTDFCPDLLGADGTTDKLEIRCAAAWAASERVFENG